MMHPKGEILKVGFDGHLRLEFHGSKVISDAGLLAYRDLDIVCSGGRHGPHSTIQELHTATWKDSSIALAADMSGPMRTSPTTGAEKTAWPTIAGCVSRSESAYGRWDCQATRC